MLLLLYLSGKNNDALPRSFIKTHSSFKKLPGIGNRSAERFAFHLLNWSDHQLDEFSVLVGTIKDKLQHCSTCGCLMGTEGCLFCQSKHRNSNTLCVVAYAKDVFAIEETQEYEGLYHVLGGILSPLDRKGPEELSIPKLKDRLVHHQVKEIIIALDSTLEGDATSLYLKQELTHFPIKISRLAFGLPMGSSLDYVNGGTLARALAARGQF